MSDPAVNKAHTEGGSGAPTSTGARHFRLRRLLIVTIVMVLGVAAVAYLADLAVAVRAERSLARAMLATPRVDYEPQVTLKGFPFTTHARDGRFSGSIISARGVPIDGCATRGGCHAEMSVVTGDLRAGRSGFRFDSADTLAADDVAASVRLDSPNLGRLLGITDLYVTTPAEPGKAGVGGPGDGVLKRSHGVVLTGTVALPPTPPGGLPTPTSSPSASEFTGTSKRLSVLVNLVLTDGRLGVFAYGLYAGPEEHADPGDLDTDPAKADLLRAVLKRFTMTLPRIPMPWGMSPSSVTSAGSDILIEGRSAHRDLSLNGF
ncbi:MAG: DUF2993 domain-containing protein [Gordonia sp.]|jgi:hypothetical protein|uniref:LmeA family phospholipid-binding protein n=1 Tax=Gordonia sp. (in: high G+C Gram-positive bacteria) TaxID=84139 RepID=UPI001DFEC895|nr:DUF2993 domain-containing protein [Gordonia sp. (in: high G+C Gram-positive bacteria)]MCB1295558.1 DUF2993 domain-containing protein [Gordonia sp. (in: high G+C Gram-positive bacteria)]